VAEWYDEFEPDVKGHIQNKGWDKLDPAAAAKAAIEAHRGAEKLIGGPAEQMVRLPKDAADADGWNAVWRRLGKPEDANAYNFGEGVDEDLSGAMRAAAFANHLTPDAAKGVFEAFVKHDTGRKEKAANEEAITARLEADLLQRNWGPEGSPQYLANLDLAQRATQRLGFSADTIQKWAKEKGGAAVMEDVRKLGMAMGEARFISGQGSTQGGIMTADQAAAKIVELKSDDAWVKRWIKNGAAGPEGRELDDLVRRAHPR
jgi:hypothetical protein